MTHAIDRGSKGWGIQTYKGHLLNLPIIGLDPPYP